MEEVYKKKKSHWQNIKEVSTPDQMFCLGFTILLLWCFPTVFKTVERYTHYRRLERPDYAHQSISDFLYVPLYVIIIRILKLAIHRCSDAYYRKNLIKYNGEDLERKIIKWKKGIFKVVFFGFTWLFGWRVVLTDTKFTPPMMFGEGELMYMMSDWPYIEMPRCLKFYYAVSLSYYVEDLVVHLFQSPSPDFFEMILHHLIASLLIFASYFNSLWNFGIFVLMQMDIADMFVGLIRSVMDFAPVYVCVIIYAGIMFGFIYFRIIVFTYCILYKFWFVGRLGIDGYPYVVHIIVLLLIWLLGLNIYWTYLLTKMGWRLATKGTKEDLQNIVVKKDVSQ